MTKLDDSEDLWCGSKRKIFAKLLLSVLCVTIHQDPWAQERSSRVIQATLHDKRKRTLRYRETLFSTWRGFRQFDNPLACLR